MQTHILCTPFIGQMSNRNLYHYIGVDTTKGADRENLKHRRDLAGLLNFSIKSIIKPDS